METEIHISVQRETFDQNIAYQWLSGLKVSGAVVLFIGKVREMNLGDNVQTLYLEHYPAMTEKALQSIVQQACQRWALQRVQLIHRVGKLQTGDEIVLVGVAAEHRGDAYQANEFIMDYLKTQAPFWKKELIDKGTRWIAERDSDKQAAEKW